MIENVLVYRPEGDDKESERDNCQLRPIFKRKIIKCFIFAVWTNMTQINTKGDADNCNPDTLKDDE